MPNIAIEKVRDGKQKTLPVFEDIDKRFNQIRQRASELFERWSREFSHELDDWLRAERDVLSGWSAAELKETDGRYELKMTLPGYGPEEIRVAATPAEVIVHAEAQHDDEAGGEGRVLWTEFGSDKVHRRFVFPEGIDVDKAHARLENGVLYITAAIAPAPQPKPVEVVG